MSLRVKSTLIQKSRSACQREAVREGQRPVRAVVRAGLDRVGEGKQERREEDDDAPGAAPPARSSGRAPRPLQRGGGLDRPGGAGCGGIDHQLSLPPWRACTRRKIEAEDDGHQHLRGGHRRAVADAERLEEVEVGEIGRHDGGVVRPAGGEHEHRREHLQRGDGGGEADDEGLRPQHRDGDGAEALQPARAVDLGRLVKRRIDPGEAGHEDDQRIADLEPDHDAHHREQREVRIAEPVLREGMQARGHREWR